MKEEYYKKLCEKLLDTYNDCCKKLESKRAVILSKRELEDLYILWKNEAPKKWEIKKDAQTKDEVNKK